MKMEAKIPGDETEQLYGVASHEQRVLASADG
jgi:hypothetical protein